MFCPACGKEVAESDAFCRYCARSLTPEKRASTDSAQKPSAAIGPATKSEEPIRRSSEATASLILGLFSFVPVVGLVAVIFGHLARASIRRGGGRLLGEGMAMGGLLLGYLGLAFWVIYGLSVVIQPVLSLPSRRRAVNERVVVLSLRTINTAAMTYWSQFEDAGFPPTLAALGPLKGQKPYASAEEILKGGSKSAAGLIDEVLASGTESGYRFTYVAGKPDSTGRIVRYAVHADPVTPGVTEEKHFFTDYSGVIRFEIGKNASADSPRVRD